MAMEMRRTMMVRDFAVGNPSAHLSITESAFAHPAGQPQSLLGRKSCGTGDWRGFEQLRTFLGHGDVRLRGLLAMAMGMVDLTFPRSKTAKQKARAANQSWTKIARAPLTPICRLHTARPLSCSERVSRCVLGARYDDRSK